jgi:hypothetical protein
MRIKQEVIEAVGQTMYNQPTLLTPMRTPASASGNKVATPPSLADLKSNRMPTDPFWAAEGLWNQRQAEELRYREDNLRLRVLLHKHHNDLLDIQLCPNHDVICGKVTETANELAPACCVDQYFERIYNEEASLLQGIGEVRKSPPCPLGTWNWDREQEDEMRYREDNLIYRTTLHKHHSNMIEIQNDPSPETIRRMLEEAARELAPKCPVDRYFEAIYNGEFSILEGLGKLV